MAAVLRPQLQDDVLAEDQVLRKVFKHLVTFLFILYIVAYLDRINIGFAALSMNKELKLTATMFGLANTIFYAGYALFEIPSNLMLTRFGARRWIARILVTWGIFTVASALASGAASLYGNRLMIGIAEAGFVPGVLLYLTYWFPPTYRARATAMFLIAQPVTIALASPLSGLILDHANGLFGISGWRWLFLTEGIPAVILGFVALFYLSDGPAGAKWLTETEKVLLRRRLERESIPAAKGSAWREVLSRDTILLSLSYFGLVVGLNSYATWSPQIVRELMKVHSFSYVGLVTAFPAVLTAIAMPLWGARSDRKMERTAHLVLPIILAALGWLLVAFVHAPEVRMLGLIFCSVGAFAGMTIFWTIPPMVLSGAGLPIGLAFINMIGLSASSLSPLVVGFLKDLTHSWVSSLLYVVVMLVGAAGLVTLVKGSNRSRF